MRSILSAGASRHNLIFDPSPAVLAFHPLDAELRSFSRFPQLYLMASTVSAAPSDLVLGQKQMVYPVGAVAECVLALYLGSLKVLRALELWRELDAAGRFDDARQMIGYAIIDAANMEDSISLLIQADEKLCAKGVLSARRELSTSEPYADYLMLSQTVVPPLKLFRHKFGAHRGVSVFAYGQLGKHIPESHLQASQADLALLSEQVFNPEYLHEALLKTVTKLLACSAPLQLHATFLLSPNGEYDDNYIVGPVELLETPMASWKDALQLCLDDMSCFYGFTRRKSARPTP